jgi:hypothetical protein
VVIGLRWPGTRTPKNAILIKSNGGCAEQFNHIFYLLPPLAAGWLEDWDAVASSLASQLRISSTSF